MLIEKTKPVDVLDYRYIVCNPFIIGIYGSVCIYVYTFVLTGFRLTPIDGFMNWTYILCRTQIFYRHQISISSTHLVLLDPDSDFFSFHRQFLLFVDFSLPR